MKSTIGLTTDRQTVENLLKVNQQLTDQVKVLTDQIANLLNKPTNHQQFAKNWREIKARREKVMASIDRFIEQIPNLTDTEIEEYLEQYTNTLSDCHDNEDYYELSLKTLRERVIKAKQGCQPPKYQVEQLPSPSEICPFDNIVLYCQIANQQLTQDSLKAEYMSKVPYYTKWYINDLYTNYLPSLLNWIKSTKRPDFTENQCKNLIISEWNKQCTNFTL